MRHKRAVIGHNELLDWLSREREAGRLVNADLVRLLKLPSSRVAEIFEGRRRIQLDEAKAIVENYGLEPVADVSAQTLRPILAAVLPLAPPSNVPERLVTVLAEAVAYGLTLLPSQLSTNPSDDALGVAARAAALRFRDLSLQ